MMEIESPTTAAAIDIEFAKDLIEYATQGSRLLFVERCECWRQFHNSNAGNNAKYIDYTPQQLCTKFVNVVLPEIFLYALTDDQRRMIELLELHPEFMRMDHGFQLLPMEQRVASNRELLPNVDMRMWPNNFLPVDEDDDEPTTQANAREFTLDLGSAATSHTLIMPVESRQFQSAGAHFQFSKENHALLSAALSNNFELSGCVLYEPHELHARLRAAKAAFEQNGQLPMNCLQASQLLEKLVKVKRSRAAIIDIVNKKFM